MNSTKHHPPPFFTQTVYSWKNFEMINHLPEITLSAWGEFQMMQSWWPAFLQHVRTKKGEVTGDPPPIFFEALDLFVDIFTSQKRGVKDVLYSHMGDQCGRLGRLCCVQRSEILGDGGCSVNTNGKTNGQPSNSESVSKHTSNNNSQETGRWTLTNLSSRSEKGMEKMENQVPLRNDEPELEAREKRGSNDPALLKGALLKGVLSTWSYSPSKWIASPRQERLSPGPRQPYRCWPSIPVDFVLYKEDTCLRDISIL